MNQQLQTTPQAPDDLIGKRFSVKEDGYGFTRGYGSCTETFEVVSVMDGICICKMTSSDKVYNINPAYRQQFSIEEVKKHITNP